MAVGRRALGLAETDGGGWYASNLAISIMERYRHSGAPADLNEAVSLFRDAVQDPQAPQAARADRSSNLGAALATRFEASGASEDMDEAVAVIRNAVRLAEEPLARASYGSNLAGALLIRYRWLGALPDLNEAVALANASAKALPQGHPDRYTVASQLGLALRIRYERLGSRDDLDEAVLALTEAREDPMASGRAAALSNLGSALRLRFAEDGDATDIDVAVQVGREAVQISPVGSPVRIRYLANLAAALSTRYPLAHRPEDLDEAVLTAEEAASAVAEADPLRALVFANKGLALVRRHELLGNPDDHEASLAAYREAASNATAGPLARIIGAREWAALAAERRDWPAAAEGYELAVDLLPRTVPRRLRRADQQYQLARLGGLSGDAAAVALELGDADRALSLLEQGRGVLLGQALETRTDLDLLRRAAPDLVSEFEELRLRLNQTPAAEYGPAYDAVREAEDRVALERRWNGLLDRIRTRDGLSAFLRLPEASDLCRRLGDEPVVAVNVSVHRCDALIITGSGVESLRLDGLSYGDALSQANALLEAAHSDDRRESAITEVLAWLWEAVAEPVLSVLSKVERLWWMPTGPLTVLPLHAAGYPADSGASVHDRVVSSYVPTVKALIHARGMGSETVVLDPAMSGIAAVGVTGSGEQRLGSAVAEVQDVLDILGLETEPLLDTAATRAAVEQALRTSSWAHFACHAVADAADPSESRLLLDDEPLPIREIPGLRRVGGHLAYLSACATSFGGTSLVDEAIHIASAFQLAGYMNVVGTLWPVADRVARRVACDFYTALLPGHATAHSPARALHHAVSEARRRYPEAPSVWAGFVHSGR